MNVLDLVASLSLDRSSYDASLDAAAQEADTFGTKLTSAFQSAIKIGAVAATAVAGIGTAFVASTAKVAEYGDNIDKMSQKMGLSARAYQEWDAVMQHSGTSIDSMKMGMRTLATAVETGNKAFQKLGLTQEQLSSMSQEQLFETTITALQNVQDETERTYLAGQLLGRGASELGALLNTSAEDTQAMKDRVHELGGVLSDESVKAAARFEDSLQDMQTAMVGTTRKIQAELLPGLADFMDGFSSLLIGEDGAEEKIQQGINNVAASMKRGIKELSRVVKTILPSMVDAITDLIPDMVDAILPVVLQGATQLFISLAAQAPKLIATFIDAVGKALSSGFDAIFNNLSETIPILSGLFNGLKDAIKLIIPVIQAATVAFIAFKAAMVIDTLATTFISGLSSIQKAVKIFKTEMALSSVMTANVGAISKLKTAVMALGASFSGVSGAFSALGTAIAAHPFIAATVAIGGLIAATVALASGLANAKTKADEMADSFEDMRKASNEQAEADLAQIEHAKVLAYEFKELIETKRTLTDAEKAHRDVLYDEINKVLPDLIEKTGEGAEAQYELKDSIEAVTTAMKAQAVYEAYQDDYKEAAKGLIEIDKNRAEALTELAEKRKQLSDMDYDMGGVYEGLLREIDGLEKEISKYDELQDTYQTTISNVEQLAEAIKGGTDNAEAMETAMHNLGVGLKSVNEMSMAEVNAELETVNRQIENIEFALKNKNLSDTMRDHYNNLLNEINGRKSELQQAGKATIAAFVNGIDSNGEEVTGAIGGILSRIKNKLGTADFKAEGKQAAKTYVDGMVNGFKSINRLSEMTQDALDKCIKAYDKSYNERKKILDKEYDDYKDNLDDEYKALKKINDKKLDAIKKSQDEEVKAFKKATQAKIDLINEEYTESIKLVDEEKYNKIKKIDEEIAALNSATKEENKAQEKRDQERRIAQLKANIRDADSFEDRRTARQELDDYLLDIEQKETQEIREEQIDRLEDQKDAIEDEAEQRKDALRAEKDERISALEDQREAELELIQENHEAYREQRREEFELELEQLRKYQEAELKQIQEGNTEKLNDYKDYVEAKKELLKNDGDAKAIDDYILNTVNYTNQKTSVPSNSDYFSQIYQQKQNALNAGANIVQSLNDGLQTGLNAISDTASDISNAIADTINDFFGIHSPSRWAKERGQYIIKGLTEGLSDDSELTSSVEGLAENIQSSFDTISPEVKVSNVAQKNPVMEAVNSLKKMLSSQALAGAGDITIPVYVGQHKVDELVVNATRRTNFRSGGW